MTRKRTSSQNERPGPKRGNKKRKRGGQPGNTNALKHGFYTRLFKGRERQLFSLIPENDTRGEIELTRVSNRRILQAMYENPNLSYEQILAGARAISQGNALIAGLNRARFQASLAASEAREMETWLRSLLEEQGDDGDIADQQEGTPV